MVSVFELANCQQCSQEYIIGKEREGYLKPVADDDKPEYFMIAPERESGQDIVADGDAEAVEPTNVAAAEAYELCTVCGRLELAGIRQRALCCAVSDNAKWMRVWKIKPKHASQVVNTCASCGGVSKAIIKRFMTANQPATYVVANSLYEMIPPQKRERPKQVVANGDFLNDLLQDMHGDAANHGPELIGVDQQEPVDERGRKLLVFSDNRQEAAFFAAYMDNKYNQLMWRRLILRELRQEPQGMYVSDLLKRLLVKAQDAMLFPVLSGESLSTRAMTRTEKENMVATYVFKELLVFERRQGLEGSGYVRFFPESLLDRIKGKTKEEWRINGTEIWSLLCVVMDTLRQAGAMRFPDNLDPEDEEFEPRNRHMYFRNAAGCTMPDGVVMGFTPTGKSNNRRLDYIVKILMAKGFSSEETTVLAPTVLTFLYDMLVGMRQLSYVYQKAHVREGQLYQLDYAKWQVAHVADSDTVYHCNRCGRIAQHNVAGVCPEYRCTGRLIEARAGDWRHDPYYTNLYETDRLLPMIAREHTAQLERGRAGELQSQFENGAVNVLSCSTTFEMGVDVGQLEAILLRNVPPQTANYVQRAGRAGRRTSATAFSVTFARRNNHDLNYFKDPSEIISGKIKAPYIELQNEKIAARHVNSIVLAWFFRRQEAYFNDKVRGLIGSDGRPTVIEALKEELASRPQDLMERILGVLSPEMAKRLAIQEWLFIDRLVGDDGALTLAIDARLRDVMELNNVIKERQALAETGKRLFTDSIQKMLLTFEGEETLHFLASSGVIPKYGFPVDVVNLNILSNAQEAQDVELSRDLKLAISEYAPGCEVIAAGKVWKSHAINTLRHKAWPAYRFYECPSCKKTHLPDGVHPLDQDTTEEKVMCSCGREMKVHKFIIPSFGFSTSWNEKPKKVGDARPSRFYSTDIQFGGFDSLREEEQTERKASIMKFADKQMEVVYSPQGKLVVLNRGHGGGLQICTRCGYAQPVQKGFAHDNRHGDKCPNNMPTIASLGHVLTTDVIRIKFPHFFVGHDGEGDLWLSLLYALLGGASEELGISRADINGCLDHSGDYPVILLYDESAGGAGHVKKIYTHLDKVLNAALARVDGRCGCGPETSCYGCLRGYENQMFHESLSRGMARSYLEWLLLERTHTGMVRMEVEIVAASSDPSLLTDLTKLRTIQGDAGGEKLTDDDAYHSDSSVMIPDGWKETVELTLLDGDDQAWQFCMELVQQADVPPPHEVGYELHLQAQGVLGAEALYVWHDPKVAVLAASADDETEKLFLREGWHVFRIGHASAETVADRLRSSQPQM